MNLEAIREQEHQRSVMIHQSRISSLGEMAAGVAHEINNPLAILLAKIQILQRKLNSSDQGSAYNSDFAKMQETVSRISRIVSGLKTFAQDDQDTPFVDESVFGLVHDVLEFSQEKIKAYKIRLELENISAVKIRCRPVQIQQVLMSLLSNSIYAIKEQQDAWIKIGLKENPEGLELFVEDSGFGIAPAVIDKMFQPFFTTKQVGDGTGLGLSVSLSILKNHGGDLVYDNKSPHTRFVMRFPYPKALNSSEAA